MENKKPLKRVKELKPFSKDHHHGLLLGWKIRTGLKKEIAVDRIAAYTIWFYERHLLPHFELEEKYLFPVLGMEHDLIRKALNDHQQIRSIMALPDKIDLLQLADLLEAHIRFEERELFGQIQEVATEEQLAIVERVHNDGAFIEHADQFWK